MSETVEIAGVIGGLMAAGLVVSLISTILSLGISIFYIIVNWKLYEKMGEPGWVSIVPFYNTWVLCEKVVGNGAKMFLMLIPLFGQFVYPFVLLYKWHKAMGKDTGFAILGLFLSGITFPIMALGDATYIGPQ